MGSPAPAELTWTQLQSWPEDSRRHELINGELVVAPAPAARHQRVVSSLMRLMGNWAQVHGGEAMVGPIDVYVHEREYTEPDLIYLAPGRTDLFEGNRLPVPPDLIVEVSSPSTRSRDLGAKRDIYERFGVPEYWFIDLKLDQIVVHVLADDGYRTEVRGLDATVEPVACPGLVIMVRDIIPRG